MENNRPYRTHPLVITAAAAVIVVSLAALGAIFGLIPGHSAAQSAAPAGQVETAMTAGAAPAANVPPPAASEPPARSQAHHREAAVTPPTKRVVARADQPAAAPPAPPPVRVADEAPTSGYVERREPMPGAARTEAPCQDCGTIAGVRERTRAGDANGLGAAAGGVLGGVVGHQMGNGRGRDAMTVLGAIGGAFAGHQIEKSQKTVHEYEVTVQLDDGTTKVVTQPTMPAWRQGERVRVSGGQIVAL